MQISRNGLKHRVDKLHSPTGLLGFPIILISLFQCDFEMRGRSLQKHAGHMFSNTPDKNVYIFFCHPDLLHFKKNLQYTSSVFIYLKCTIPPVPSRSLLFQVLLIFILVACYLLISGPACFCCSSPYRWNMQASLSHSQEYSWSDDWQSRRTTCKETEILILKSRNNQNRVSLHFPKTILWPLSVIYF